ncbi:hypothetical protein K470DRAFT_268493 [Piedraia hortae CBS 480.64]|uniref:Uncharacterized protein n=1 Tax=Piedraia hortae CBS 480.64 TaxID=1314780 RepID=A0A6A7C6P2_9PEZI|nr:hypothetical protein K470DRAFT_268493 [Piedraia hortae CBS 480.64]
MDSAGTGSGSPGGSDALKTRPAKRSGGTRVGGAEAEKIGTNRAQMVGKDIGKLGINRESLGGEGNVVVCGQAQNALGLCRAMIQHEKNTVTTNVAVQDKLDIVI